MDEMIITNGIVYSVSQQKVYGLAELPSHGIINEIYNDFYGMNSDKPQSEDLSRMTYFDESSKKLIGHSATGLTQVTNINIIKITIPNYYYFLFLIQLMNIKF